MADVSNIGSTTQPAARVQAAGNNNEDIDIKKLVKELEDPAKLERFVNDLANMKLTNFGSMAIFLSRVSALQQAMQLNPKIEQNDPQSVQNLRKLKENLEGELVKALENNDTEKAVGLQSQIAKLTTSIGSGGRTGILFERATFIRNGLAEAQKALKELNSLTNR